MKRVKNILLVVFMVFITFSGYVIFVNRNSQNMTIRQKVLKAIYPAFMWYTKLRGKNVLELKNEQKKPLVSFYSLRGILNNGETYDFENLKGKKVMLVNTASDCGYTDQYNALQALAEQHKNNLVVFGFPSNDFKEQEKGTDEEIAQFCKLNYGVTFPLMKKSVVRKMAGQNEIYKWLTDSTQNGWNSKTPSWNFAKYIVNEEGVLTHYFGSSVSPLSKEVQLAIDK